MNCLVTGGAGFIGSHIVDALLERGWNVIAVDNESAKENDIFYWNENAQNYKFDICDLNKIDPLFKNIDFVFHLAAKSRIQRAIKNPDDTIAINTSGTKNILELMKKHNVKKIIFSSSSSYYGNKNKLPFKETMESDCLNAYSFSKLSAEDLIKVYNKTHGIEAVIFRYFNVYGERQPTKGIYSPVIGRFLRQKKEGKKMTVIGNGKSRRDFTHVSDVVKANILAAEKMINGSLKVLNIGTGKNYSIMDIVKMVDGPFTYIPKRLGEAENTLACIDEAREFLDWNPRVNLHDWIEETLK